MINTLPTLKKWQKRLSLAAICILNVCLANSIFAQSPLSVNGNRIVRNGEPVSFAGNSFFWSNTGWGADGFYNAQCVDWLKSDWESTIVRAAMGVNDDGGYLYDPEGNKARVFNVVDAAIDKGMYVIIDFHSHQAQDYQSQAISFFQEMATKYGNTPNVIYEIYNEPVNISWSGIKPYAEAVIGAIRAIDPDNLIIVGTPNWSQDVDIASQNPITGYSNIAYTLHFYAGTHKQYLRDKAQTALNNGIALFVTEWGTVEASGDGAVDTNETNLWMDFLRNNHISHLNWSVNDKAEGASILNQGASKYGNWSASDLTASGSFVKGIIKGWPKYDDDDDGGGDDDEVHDASSLHMEAEDYDNMSGVQIETCSEGGQDVGYIENGDWMSYNNIKFPYSGSYTIQYRVASENAGGVISAELNSGSISLGTIDVPATGGWQNWTTITQTVTVNAGTYSFGINAISGGWNLNWIKFSANEAIFLEAENYTYMDGIQTETCSEGGLNVGYTDAGDWMSYENLTFPSSGNYIIEYRVASETGGTIAADLNAGTTQLGSVEVPNTGGWQNWVTISQQVYIPGGQQNFGISTPNGGWNLNWIKISPVNLVSSTKTGMQLEESKKVKFFPNPASDKVHLLGNMDGATVKIIDTTGQLVTEKEVTGNTIDIEFLPSGVYLLQIQLNANDEIQTQRLIKK